MRKLIFLFLTFSFVLTLFCGCKEQHPTENMSVKVLSSGKSDCIFINIDGYRILIDCADEDDLENIKKTLDEDGTEKIDLLVITHYDNDHIGSAPEILRSYPVETLVLPDYVRHSKLTRKLLEAIEDKKGQTNAVYLKGEKYSHILEGGTEIMVDSPVKDYGTDDNANSLITLITLQNDESLLFTGDATKARLEEFLISQRGNFVFVKLPHHGSYNSEVRKLLTERRVSYAAVTLEDKDDAEKKLLELAKGSTVEFYFTSNGDVLLDYQNGKFVISQKK